MYGEDKKQAVLRCGPLFTIFREIPLAMLPSENEEASGIETPNAEANTDFNV
ncbi:MAG: hypothetical protein PHF18_05310 [Methanosarcina sp.]|uniref:hypothetical protein n=1 Tax=Methanosarcina sp. TaxID=2213 RepID=UPI0026185F4B|nr:hypothetical protein [Methanosarcina sp.]MDD3246258.1 hypothetical protein [Methanosarcina sp.]MDD4248549.1 hypothetical protein [Methanosarcina sp.]